MTGKPCTCTTDQSEGKATDMSSIEWDGSQMVALLSWLEDHLALYHGTVIVETMDVPQEAFAAEVNLTEKTFSVYANPENPMVDTTLNVFLAYIVALAYDREQWKRPVPSHEDLVDCHRLVCEAMLEFEESFAAHLEEHLPILEVWRDAHEENTEATTASAGSRSTDSLIEKLGGRMFSSRNPDDDKWNVN